MSRTPTLFPLSTAATALRRHALSAACGAALLAATLSAGAQGAGSGTSVTPGGTTTNAPAARVPAAGSTALDRSDRSFMEKAAQGGMAEVHMGKMAQERASSQQVKDFGARMVQDHSQANTALQQLASAKGVQLPAEADRSHKKDAEKFGKLTGAKFDTEYMQHMVKDHKKDVSDFEKASKSARDPEVKAFAAKTLPTLQEHLRLAQTTYDAVRQNK